MKSRRCRGCIHLPGYTNPRARSRTADKLDASLTSEVVRGEPGVAHQFTQGLVYG